MTPKAQAAALIKQYRELLGGPIMPKEFRDCALIAVKFAKKKCDKATKIELDKIINELKSGI